MSYSQRLDQRAARGRDGGSRALGDVIVLGAGMAGVAAALQLQLRGRSVVLVDRKMPGRETSYGNAGIIQSEAVEPTAMPRDFSSLLDIALGRTNDVSYRLASLPGHVGPLLRYWWHSAPGRHEAIAASYATAIKHATAEHWPLITRAGAEHLVRKEGYRDMHRTQASLDRTLAKAERVRKLYGVGFRVLSAAELARAEPNLTETGVGAIQWTDPWTVRNPGGLVAAYGELFLRSGGVFAHGDADSLERSGEGWRVTTGEGAFEAPDVVVALGPWSVRVLRRFGYRFPMVRKRGYHRHFRGRPIDLPLRDAKFGYMICPMAAGMRITTGAELSGVEAEPTPLQLGRAEASARRLLDLGAPVENQPWLGTRPCMPDMLPVVGAARRHKGMWLHFGHGHQGFTLGPATGRLLAEMMTGGGTYIDPVPFRPERYRGGR